MAKTVKRIAKAQKSIVTAAEKLSGAIGGYECYIARPASKNPRTAIILIHEIWGLDAHIKDVAERLAREGYAVFAPDLLAHTGIPAQMSPEIFKRYRSEDAEVRSQAQLEMRAALTPMSAPDFGAKTLSTLKSLFEYACAQPFVDPLHVGVMGFCFGGTYSFALAVAEPRTAFCIPFYGHAPEKLDDVGAIACPILAIYGQDDENLMKQLPGLTAKMREYKKDFTHIVYPGARHAFFNDTNEAVYDKEAAADAWKQVLAFLKKKTG